MPPKKSSFSARTSKSMKMKSNRANETHEERKARLAIERSRASTFRAAENLQQREARIDLPFDLKRLQFPVRLAFAMTVNKTQGQSLQVCGLNLANPCFSHGQFYVACSRIGKPTDLYVYAPDGQTKNIVYPKALQ